MTENTTKLRAVLSLYAVPDPKHVERLPKGGTTLDFVGHARITQWLIEIDPLWSIEPVAFDEAGLPARTKIGNMVQAGFWLTLLGHRRYCVGSVEDRKSDCGKELVSDAIRNGAMRFGIALDLWSKMPLGDEPDAPAPARKPAPKKAVSPSQPNMPAPHVVGVELVDPVQLEKFYAACRGAGLDPADVASHALVTLDEVTVNDLDALRASFKELISK